MKTIVLFLTSFALFATEIDSFTSRDSNMKDALEEINHLVQNYFKIAILQANQEKSCQKSVFENAFKETISGNLGGLFWSQMEKDIEGSLVLDKKTNTRAQSVYRDVKIQDGLALRMVNLGFLLRIGPLYIGSDKLGHFFVTGYEYYQKDSLEKALSFGEMTERTYYGLSTTGVYSYGDLSANLDGYFFWNDLVDSSNPYVTCHSNQWKQLREFDWMHYLNPAWDESLNCNYYEKPVRQSVDANIKVLGMQCPMHTNFCTDMIRHYGILSPRVINPHCFVAVHNFNRQ